MSANDRGVATRVVQGNAPAAALGPGAGHAATFASTEHFILQTARALTVSEANGRASIYLAALSTPVVAGALVGAGAIALRHRHHRRARDSYSPEAVARDAILIPPSQPAEPA